MPVARRFGFSPLVYALVSAPLMSCVASTAPLGEDAVDTPVTTDSSAPSTDSSADAASMDAVLAPETDLTPDNLPDGSDVITDVAPPMLAVGMTARVTADFLNLRTGPSTSDTILTAMPCGTQVQIVGGPSGIWWNVDDSGMTGWSSGNYLVPDSQFDPSVCMMGVADGGSTTSGDAGAVDTAGIFMRAQLGVGYSYYWGHGSWRSDGMDPGSCSGSCPSCTHTGIYGADCSGFVAKVWQVPTASPLTEDLHPFSTYNFYNDTTDWTQVPRAQIQPADALVYNANGAGHIMLFESGSDPWGNIWTYEARGCATGIVHNLRIAGTEYIAIRRNGL